MKKMMAVLLVLILTAVMLPGMGEETEETPAVTGDWYTQVRGIPMKLSFREDGTYSQEVPGVPDESAEGTWELREGFVYLDGNDEIPMAFNETVLLVDGSGIRFTREEPEIYIPDGIASADETDLMEFQGAWSSSYVLSGSLALPAEYMRDDTILYIEGRRVALTGDLFGDVVAEFTYEDGALILTDPASDMRITLQMQLDHKARMTIQAGGAEMTLILGTYMTEGLQPETGA